MPSKIFPSSLFLLLLSGLVPILSWAQEIQTVIQKGHNAAIKSQAIHPSGRYVLTGSRDKTIKLWDVVRGHELRTYYGHEATVNGLVFSSDGRTFFSTSADKTIRIWETETGKSLGVWAGNEDLLTDVAISPDGQWLLTSGY